MKRVTAIGEILFDIYSHKKNIGGAPFNFLYHIRKLTGSGNFISRIGDDNEGNEIIDFLEKNGMPTEFIQVDNVHSTGESVAKLNEKKIPSWQIKTGAAYDFIELTGDVKSLVENKTDCLYFGTLAQRYVTSRNTIQSLFNRKIIYFCDLNVRQNFYSEKVIKECISVSDVLKLNIEELHLVNDLILKKSFDARETPDRLMSGYGLDILCVTYGDQGAHIFKGEKMSYHKIKVNKIVDTVGAGDAYAAILCIGCLQNWDIEKINSIASEFAGEIVNVDGALPADTDLYEKYRSIINE